MSIYWFTNLLRNEQEIDPKDKEKYLQRITVNVVHMEKMIEEFVDYFRLLIDSSIKMPKSPMDPQMLEAMVNDIVEYKTKDGVFGVPPITYEWDSTFKKISFNPIWLKKLLGVLLDNSLKYVNPEKPRLWIGAQESKKNTLLYIENNGIELPKKERKKVFAPLYRGELQGEQKVGSGLGLTVAKLIADQYGAKLWIEALGPQRHDQGTRVVFSLPH